MTGGEPGASNGTERRLRSVPFRPSSGHLADASPQPHPCGLLWSQSPGGGPIEEGGQVRTDTKPHGRKFHQKQPALRRPARCPREEKERASSTGVFTSVGVPTTKLMNDLMSACVHRIWKDAMMDWLAAAPRLSACSDVAGGTATSASAFCAARPGRKAVVLRSHREQCSPKAPRGAEAQSLAGSIDWGLGRMPWRCPSKTRVSMFYNDLLRHPECHGGPEDALAEAYGCFAPAAGSWCSSSASFRTRPFSAPMTSTPTMSSRGSARS